MKISFLVNPIYTYDKPGWEPTDVRLSGTERGVVEWAEELTKRGHYVIVYKNGREDSFQHNGVNYKQSILYEVNPESDVCVNVKSPDVSPTQPTIFYTNDVDADKQDLSAYDAVIHISGWAKENIPINNPNVFVVPHGYDNSQIYRDFKIKKQCLYASSPDRGLDILLRAWPSVMAAHPDATLLVTYGYEGPVYQGIHYLGDVSEERMNEVYRTSEFWLYPCIGNELQCIVGMKAQAAGCWPIYFPYMALKETVKFGKRSSLNMFSGDIIRAMSGKYELPNPLPLQPTIEQSTDELLKVIDFVYNKSNN